MFNSTVCRLTFSISLVCLILINLHVSSDFGASAWDFNKIVVEVPPSKVEATGPIKVSLFHRVPFITSHSNKIINSFGTSVSDSSFEYTNPTFKQVIPAEVQIFEINPIEVHIIGNNFDIIRSNKRVQVELTIFGEKPVIFIGHIVNRTHIRFAVYKLPTAQYNISVLFNQSRTETGLVFDSVGNPMIDSVDTKTARCTGQTSIIVKGNYFHRIQNIESAMSFDLNWTKCRVDSSSQMTCFATKYPFNLESGQRRSAEIDFYTANFTIMYPRSKTWPISYFPDPNFDNVAEDTKVYINDPVLQLSGNDLYFGSNILISVGNWTCEFLPEQQKANQLLCKIQFGDDLPVEGESVAVGYRLRENDETNNFGNIVLLSRSTPEAIGFLKKHWYIPVTIAIVILSFAIAIAYWKITQRKSEREREQDGKHAEFQLSEYKHVTGITKGKLYFTAVNAFKSCICITRIPQERSG